MSVSMKLMIMKLLLYICCLLRFMEVYLSRISLVNICSDFLDCTVTKNWVDFTKLYLPNAELYDCLLQALFTVKRITADSFVSLQIQLPSIAFFMCCCMHASPYNVGANCDTFAYCLYERSGRGRNRCAGRLSRSVKDVFNHASNSN